MRAVPITPRQVMFTVCGQCPSLHAEELNMCSVPGLPAQIAIYSLFYLHISHRSCAVCALISPISTYTDTTSTKRFFFFFEWSFKPHKDTLLCRLTRKLPGNTSNATGNCLNAVTLNPQGLTLSHHLRLAITRS